MSRFWAQQRKRLALERVMASADTRAFEQARAMAPAGVVLNDEDLGESANTNLRP